MKVIASLKNYQKAILLVALIALAASVALFCHFLSRGSVSGRALIPSEEMQHSEGFRYVWRVPANLRASPWYRAEVRILEDGKPLPFRVEYPDLVSKQGNGRFGVFPFSINDEQREFVWLSASDSTNPGNNGRKYEFEMRRTDYRLAIWSAFLLAFSIMATLVAIQTRIRFPITKIVGKQAHNLRLPLRRLAVFLAILATVALTQAWPRTRIVVPIRLSAARLIQSGNHFFYRLPSWIDQGAARELATLFEDGKPMKRSNISALESESGRGGYYFASDGLVRVCFRAEGGSNAALNGRRYTVKVPVFPAQSAMRFAVLLVFVSLLLFVCVPELDTTPFLLRGSLFGPWFKSTGWLWVIVITGLAKLWVVAGDEILAQNLDAYNYALDATAMGWPPDAPWHAPGFPMIAGIVAQFGVPWRLALEVLYLASCGLLAAEIVSLLRSRVIAVLVFAATAWHPSTLSGFHLFMSDPFVLLVSVALLSMMFRILRQPTNEWTCAIFVGVGLVSFLWEWSRTEDPLVYGTLLLFAGLALALSRRETNPASWRKRVALCALPVIMVIFLSTGVGLVNFFKYGVYAKSRMTASGITALMKALYRIKPDRDLRYAPVTRSSLQKACGASLTLRQFESALLDTNRVEVRFGEVTTKVPGEFGTGLIWVLVNSLPRNSLKGNQTMLAAASEINEALRDGRLPHRRAYYPLDPNWRLWLPDLVPSFVTCLRLASSIQRWPSWESTMVTESPFLDHDFDEAANRRAASANSPSLLVEGLVSLPLPSIDSVAVADQSGNLLAASPLGSNSLEGHAVFYLRSPLPTEPLVFNLRFFQNGKCQFTDHGHTSAWWITNKNTIVSNTAVLPDTGERLDYSYRLSVAESTKKGRIESWEPWTEVSCKELSWGAVFATLLSVLFGENWDKDRFRRVLACLVLITGWLIGRAALYALIDATSAFDTYRYMACISPLFVLILVLAAAVATAFLKSAFYKSTPPQ